MHALVPYMDDPGPAPFCVRVSYLEGQQGCSVSAYLRACGPKRIDTRGPEPAELQDWKMSAALEVSPASSIMRGVPWYDFVRESAGSRFRNGEWSFNFFHGPQGPHCLSCY